jgi:allophanate hydrolase subunit 2
MGPQEHEFTEAGISTFLNSTYRVGMDSNRMGYRLDGAVIEHKGDGNIISDGIVTGSVQVPTAGLPIVMLAERQTVGGYPKIATVISADLPKIGQCRPGDRIQFQKTTIEVAQKLHQEYINEMAELEKKLSPITKMIKGPLRSYNIKVNGTIYKFTVEEVL